MKANEIIAEARTADLYKGESFDSAEKILASNKMIGSGWLGNLPDPDSVSSDTWALRRRGAERYQQPASKIDLNPDTSEQDYEQWKRDVEKSKKRFPEKRFPSPYGSVSLTRDKNIAYNFLVNHSGVIFVLDQALLYRDLGKRIHPFQDIAAGLTRQRGPEAEESVHGGIPDVKKYIKRIEFVGSEFDPEKYPNLAKWHG
jgi:hypothetical protein